MSSWGVAYRCRYCKKVEEAYNNKDWSEIRSHFTIYKKALVCYDCKKKDTKP